MPQKINRAGKMQNYVPAGYPAGGEYGDNATGSNKHFKVFRKPDGSLSGKQIVENEPVAKKPSSEKFFNTIKNKLEVNEDAKKYSKEQVLDFIKEIKDDDVTKTFENAVDKYVDNLPPIKITKNGGSFFRRSGLKGDLIAIEEKGLEKEYENTGSVFFHEFTHWITDNMELTVEVDRPVSRWRDDGETKKVKEKFKIGLAPIFDGKSFTDIIREESKSLNRKATVIKPLKDEQTKQRKEAVEKLGVKYEDFENNLKEIKDKYFSDIIDSIRADYSSSRISFNDAKEKLSTKNLFDEAIKKYPDKKNMLNETQKCYNADQAAQNKWLKESGIAIVSDMLSNNSSGGFGLGHEEGYFKTSKNHYGEEMNDNLSNEFTSEAFAALATGDSAIIETTKKLLPKSYEAFTKILKYYKGEME